MEKKNTDNPIADKAELRSEKVRKLIGSIPSSLVYWGMVVIVVIVLMLIGVVCLVPYPYGAGETILQHLLLKTDL